MKKIYIVIVNSEVNIDILWDRIKRIGPTYTIFENSWLVSSTETAKQIYENLIEDNSNSTFIFVTEIDKANYYGIMNSTLWDWIKTHS